MSTDSETQRDSGEDSQSGSSTRHVKFSQLAGAEGRNPLDGSPEANVILISSPEGERLGRRWQLRSGAVFEVGRSADVDISLPDVLSVSRRHALLRFELGVVWLEDLGSTNGSYVNDQLVEKRAELQSGDRFQVGTVHFKFLQGSDVESAYYDTLYRLAMRDGLTDIFNKRKFDEELEREFHRAERYDRPLSLILFDLDLFKKVNDEFGHLCGDHVLKEVAARTRRHLRPEQTFARVGGEEFAVLSPEVEAAGSQRLSEKLRAEIAAEPVEFRDWKVPVTCSFGVSEKNESMRHAEQLFEAADTALYAAKQGGRNRVSLSNG